MSHAKTHAHPERDTHGKDTHGKDRDGQDGVASAAQHAFERSRDSAREAAQRTAAGIEANPLGVLVGGLAVGAIAAALIPRSEREKDLLAPVGKRIGAAATAALATAKESGKAELANLGISRDAARDQAQGLFGGLGKALSEAGNAAVKAAREPAPATRDA